MCPMNSDGVYRTNIIWSKKHAHGPESVVDVVM